MVVGKIIKVVTVAAAIVVVGGAGVGGWYWYSKHAVQNRLFTALGKDTAYGHVVVQQSTGAANSQATARAYISPDGTYKISGSITCTANVPYVGTLKMNVNAVQVQADNYVQFVNMRFSDVRDSQTQQSANDFLSKFDGKWLQITQDDPDYQGFKQYGMLFGDTGMTTTKLKPAQIAAKLKASKAIKIVSVTNTTYDSEPAVEYKLAVNRDGYSRFMDSVQPGFKYKDGVINNIFDDGPITTNVIISKQTGLVVAGYEPQLNPCTDLVSTIDPSANSNVPQHVTVKTYYETGNDVPSAVKPKSFMTVEEFEKMFAEQ